MNSKIIYKGLAVLTAISICCVFMQNNVSSEELDRPDFLAEQVIYSPIKIVEEGIVSFKGNVRNIGAGYEDIVRVDLVVSKLDGEGAWVEQNRLVTFLDGLLEDESKEVLWREGIVTLERSAYRFEMCVDDGEVVQESDESNNCVTYEQPIHEIRAKMTGKGNGRVLSLDGRIDCGENCESYVDYLEKIELTAVPDSFSYFVGWRGQSRKTGGTPIGFCLSKDSSDAHTYLKALDSDLTTAPDCKGTGGGAFVGRSLHGKRQITSIEYVPTQDAQKMINRFFEASVDGVNWTVLATISQKPSEGVINKIDVQDENAYRFVRYNGGFQELPISDLKFYGFKVNECTPSGQGTCQLTANESHTVQAYFEELDGPGIILGDVNNSGSITAADAQLALIESVSGAAYSAVSDADCNGKVTASDALRILRAAVGSDPVPMTCPSSGTATPSEQIINPDSLNVDVVDMQLQNSDMRVVYQAPEFKTWEVSCVACEPIIDGPQLSFTVNAADDFQLTVVSEAEFNGDDPTDGIFEDPIEEQLLISGLSLVNANSDIILGELIQGATIDLAQIGTNEISIIAHTAPEQVGSVQFVLRKDSNIVVDKTENNAVYCLKGDYNSTDFIPWYAETGSYTLTVSTFSDSNKQGTQGDQKVIAFTIIDTPIVPVDTTPPIVTIKKPSNNDVFETSAIYFHYAIEDGEELSLTIEERHLTVGKNTLVASAQDAAGNIGRDSIVVYYEPNRRNTVNVLSNGDFENGKADWKGWSARKVLTNNCLNEQCKGSNSVLLDVGGLNLKLTHSNVENIVPGKSYNISADIKTINALGDVYLEATWKKKGGGNIGSPIMVGNIKGTHLWKNYSTGDIIAPPEAAKLRIRLIATKGKGGKAYFDNVSVMTK